MYINIYSCPGSATGASLPAAHCPRCLPWPCRASLSEKGRPSGPRAQSPPPHPWQASPRGTQNRFGSDCLSKASLREPVSRGHAGRQAGGQASRQAGQAGQAGLSGRPDWPDSR